MGLSTPIYATPAGLELYDESLSDDGRAHGPPTALCTVHGPGDAKLYLSDDELEEFERDTNTPLVDDCPPPKVWRRLLRWLLKNLGLFDVTRNVEIKLAGRVPTEPDCQI